MSHTLLVMTFQTGSYWRQRDYGEDQQRDAVEESLTVAPAPSPVMVSEKWGYFPEAVEVAGGAHRARYCTPNLMRGSTITRRMSDMRVPITVSIPSISSMNAPEWTS